MKCLGLIFRRNNSELEKSLARRRWSILDYCFERSKSCYQSIWIKFRRVFLFYNRRTFGCIKKQNRRRRSLNCYLQKRKHWSGNRGRSSLINPTSNRFKLFKLLKLPNRRKRKIIWTLACYFEEKKEKKKEGKVAIEATGTEIEFAGYDRLDFHPLEWPNRDGRKAFDIILDGKPSNLRKSILFLANDSQ